MSGINIDDGNIVKDHNSPPFVEDVQRSNLLLVKVSTVSHLGSFGVHCVFNICHFDAIIAKDHHSRPFVEGFHCFSSHLSWH